MHWGLQVAMEADPNVAHAVMDAINGFNELEPQAMRAAICGGSTPTLHPPPL